MSVFYLVFGGHSLLTSILAYLCQFCQLIFMLSISMVQFLEWEKKSCIKQKRDEAETLW